MKTNFEKFCEHFAISKSTADFESILTELKNADAYSQHDFTINDKKYVFESQDYEASGWIRYLNGEEPGLLYDESDNDPQIYYGTYSPDKGTYIHTAKLPQRFYTILISE